jgi:GNAT superfamily N-acetyltransferase
MIRHAEHHDIAAMVAVGREMHATSIFSKFDFNEEKLALHIGMLIELDSGIALVSEVDGEIQGGFIGAVVPHFFGNDLQSFDYALFLTEHARTGATGLRLIKAYIAEARAKGANQIMLANSTGYQPERVARLFESMGFKRLGYVFELSQDELSV